MKKILVGLTLLASMSSFAISPKQGVQYGVASIESVGVVLCAFGIGSGFLTAPAAVCSVVLAMDAAGRFMNSEEAGFVGMDNFVMNIISSDDSKMSKEASNFIQKWRLHIEKSGALSNNDTLNIAQELTLNSDLAKEIFNTLSDNEDSNEMNQALIDLEEKMEEARLNIN